MTGDNDDRHVGVRPDLPQQVEAVLLAEPKIEDHQVDLGGGELADHLLTARRHQGADVVLREIVYDHPLQRRIILDDEDADLTIARANAGVI